MKTAWGTITAIDGGGFEIAHDGGKLSFMLGLDMVVEEGELRDLFEKHVEVTVHYDDIPNEATHVAYRVFPSDRPTFQHQAQ